MVNEHEGAVSWRKSLRNDAINYRAGWWAVTIQVEKNKSIFGAIVGEKVFLNALGAAEFSAWQKYIQKNPANWSRDRYGACTAYSWGNIDLLNCKRVAFVASQGFFASDLRARKVWARGSKGATKVDPSDSKVAADKEVAQIDKVLISTFTSVQEREALRRALLKKKPLIAVFPGGIPCKKEMMPEFVAAIHEGWALVLSPQPPNSRLNKKIATWCNEYVLRNADEIWVGSISPNGMLAQMLAGLGLRATL